MKKTRKYGLSILAIILTLIVGVYYSMGNFFMGNGIIQKTRTVFLADSDINYQALLNEFEDGELIQEGGLTTFTGIQVLDTRIFEEIDTISEEEFEDLNNCVISYAFTYDSDNNIVTISAEMENEYGEIEVDTLTGVGFINEQGEIDAVMNVEGEGILLSEMKDAGLIQNCGWFSRLVKKVAKVVVVSSVVVAAAAVVVATAGAVAPAVVAAGVGVVASTATGVAATIAAYATVTAAIAAGVTITVEMWERYYPGIEVIISNNIAYAKWNEETKTAVKDIIKAEKKKRNPAIYFHVTKYNSANGPLEIDITNYYTVSQMSGYMNTSGWSSLTETGDDAFAVITSAFFGYSIVLDTHGMKHYHAKNSNGSHVTAGPYNYTVHSFFYE